MTHDALRCTHCLTHQLPEDQSSPIGLVCPQCARRLRDAMPLGRCMSFWESQPAAYSPCGQPCFVYTLIWDDFRIRSLHPPDSSADLRSARFAEPVTA